jgi:hypothetical protein
MVTLRVEDSVKQKILQLQSCREFHGKRSEYKIHLILSPDGWVRPDLVQPKMGRRESERLYKWRNSSSWGTPPPTNLQPLEPRFRLPHGYHLHGGGLPLSHEGRGLRGGAPPWCRQRGSPPCHRRRHHRAAVAARAPRCSSLPSSPLSPSPTLSIMQWFILPHNSVPSYVNMVFDAIIFILWSMSCLHSLFVLRLICWMSLVH